MVYAWGFSTFQVLNFKVTFGWVDIRQTRIEDNIMIAFSQQCHFVDFSIYYLFGMVALPIPVWFGPDLKQNSLA